MMDESSRGLAVAQSRMTLKITEIKPPQSCKIYGGL